MYLVYTYRLEFYLIHFALVFGFPAACVFFKLRSLVDWLMRYRRAVFLTTACLFLPCSP